MMGQGVHASAKNYYKAVILLRCLKLWLHVSPSNNTIWDCDYIILH